MKKSLFAVLFAFSSVCAAQTVTCDKTFVMYGENLSPVETVPAVTFNFDKTNPTLTIDKKTVSMDYDVGDAGPILGSKTTDQAFLLTEHGNVIVFNGNSPIYRVYADCK